MNYLPNKPFCLLIPTVGFYTNKQNIKKREEWLNRAVRMGPKSSISEHYGDVLYKLDRKEEALKYWQEAKRLEEVRNC